LALARFRLEPNTRYRLSFAAYSNTARDLSIFINNSTTPSLNYGLSNYRANLTKAWKTFNVEFTTKNFTSLTNATQLRFSMGAFARAGDVYFLDSVILKKVEPGVTAAAVGGISGAVQTIAGSPLLATVTLVDVETSGTTLQAAVQTDATGSYRFDALPVGLYEVRIQPLDGHPVPEPVQVYVSEEPVEELLIEVGEPAEEENATNTLYLPLISQ
jgi:hypothetical protein